MNYTKQRFHAFSFVLVLTMAFFAFAGCRGENDGEPDVVNPPNQAVEMGTIEVQWPYPQIPTGSSSQYVLPLLSTDVSHFRVVAFLTGTLTVPEGAGVVARADVNAEVSTATATLTVTAGATYDVCSLIIADPMQVTIGLVPGYLGGACSAPVAVIAGQTATADIIHVLSALSVATVDPFALIYPYGGTAEVAFVSTGLPTNIASAAIYSVDQTYPTISPITPIGCASVVMGTPCVTSPLGFPGKTTRTFFKFLAEVNASAYARDHGLEAGGASSGLTLWPSWLLKPPETDIRVLSADHYIVDPETSPLNINLR